MAFKGTEQVRMKGDLQIMIAGVSRDGKVQCHWRDHSGRQQSDWFPEGVIEPVPNPKISPVFADLRKGEFRFSFGADKS